MDDTYYGTASLVEARVWPLAASPDPSTQAMLDILASTWRQMRLGALGIPLTRPGGNAFGQLFSQVFVISSSIHMEGSLIP